MKLIGLDLETSGTEIDDGAVPIQLGLSYEINGHYYTWSSYVGGWNWKEHHWDTESAAVHNIPRNMLTDFEAAWKVDIRMANWLLDYIGPRMWNLPVGWNVAGFDMPFIRRYFPNLSRMLSYRSVDLTPLVVAMAEENERKYQEIKNRAKTAAAQEMESHGGTWHDAGFDAEASLRAYRWLLNNGLHDEVVYTTTITEENFDMLAACRKYTHDYDILPPTQQKNVRRIITDILIAGAGI